MSLYNGILTNSEAFEAFLARWAPIRPEWPLRDQMASAWNAALDAKDGRVMTQKMRRERADQLDREREIEAEQQEDS